MLIRIGSEGPMRRHTATIALALLSLMVGACASDDTSSTTTPGTGTATTGTGTTGTGTTGTGAAGAFTPQQLSNALLTASDLGDGWTEMQRDMFTTREPENPSIDPSLWCPAADADGLAALAGQEGADVELSLGTPEALFLVRQQAWTNADVDRYLAAATAAVATCLGVTWDDGAGNTYTLQPSTTMPTIGDESISWTVTVELEDTNRTASFADQTIARLGDVVMVIQGGGSMTTSPAATAPDLVPIVRAAGDKMTALTG
jgi:hypothetical protein